MEEEAERDKRGGQASRERRGRGRGREGSRSRGRRGHSYGRRGEERHRRRGGKQARKNRGPGNYEGGERYGQYGQEEPVSLPYYNWEGRIPLGPSEAQPSNGRPIMDNQQRTVGEKSIFAEFNKVEASANYMHRLKGDQGYSAIPVNCTLFLPK